MPPPVPEIETSWPTSSLIVPLYVTLAALPLIKKSVPVAFVIELPVSAEKVPLTAESWTPPAVLLVLCRVARRRSAARLLSLHAIANAVGEKTAGAVMGGRSFSPASQASALSRHARCSY